MGSIGIPELVVILSMVALYAIPIVAAVWLLRTIARMSRVQEDMLNSLKAIERTLDGKKTG
jgi:hypothetical protein